MWLILTLLTHFDKEIEINLKILQNVVKKEGHSVKDCWKLVLNYSIRGSLGKRKTKKKGVNGWEQVEKRGFNVAKYSSQQFIVSAPLKIWTPPR